MLKLPKPLLLSIAFLYSAFAIAQDVVADKSDTEGFMRSNGKIYVVAAIALTVLIGLILYVVRLDRKITALEKDKPS